MILQEGWVPLLKLHRQKYHTAVCLFYWNKSDSSTSRSTSPTPSWCINIYSKWHTQNGDRWFPPYAQKHTLLKSVCVRVKSVKLGYSPPSYMPLFQGARILFLNYLFIPATRDWWYEHLIFVIRLIFTLLYFKLYNGRYFIPFHYLIFFIFFYLLLNPVDYILYNDRDFVCINNLI